MSMIKLKVSNQQISLDGPLTVEQWKSISKWDIEIPEYWINVISEATGITVPELRTMDFEQRRLAVVMIAHSLQLREPCHLPDFESINFGQFIDCEYYLALGLQKSIDTVLEVLNIEVENARQALWAIEQYQKWRTNIYKRYAGLFGTAEVDQIDPEQQDKKVAADIAKAWYRILFDLSGEQIHLMDPITEEPVKKVFNFMAVKKERAEEELKRLKRQKNELQGRRK